MKLRMDRARTPRPRSLIAFVVSALLAVAAVGVTASAPPAGAAANRTSVMGPNLMNADQLTRWFNAKRAGQAGPRLPALNNDVHALAQIFIDEGRTENVRGDIAFVQSVIETGWFVFPDAGQIRPDFNNYAGINANNGRRKGTTCADEVLDAPALSRCFPTPQIGVRAQIQLLRGYADPLSRNLPNRLRMPPSDRIGLAPWWEYFGGNSPSGKLIWASAPDYGIRILQLFSGALMFNGMPALGGYPDVTAPDAILDAPPRARSRGPRSRSAGGVRTSSRASPASTSTSRTTAGPGSAGSMRRRRVGSSRPRRAATSRSSAPPDTRTRCVSKRSTTPAMRVRSPRRSRRQCRVRRAGRPSSRRRTRWDAAASCRHSPARR